MASIIKRASSLTLVVIGWIKILTEALEHQLRLALVTLQVFLLDSPDPMNVANHEMCLTSLTLR
jgi:hypothetical protein